MKSVLWILIGIVTIFAAVGVLFAGVEGLGWICNALVVIGLFLVAIIWTETKEKEYQRMFDDLRTSTDKDWSLNISAILLRRYIGWTKESIIAG